MIHPAQIPLVQQAFTPDEHEIAEARAIVDTMADGIRSGRGAVNWQGRMIDEAVVARARRTLERAAQS